jgi:hypothetical protein
VRAFLPRGSRKWAALAFVASLVLGFFVSRYAAPLVQEALGIAPSMATDTKVTLLVSTNPPGASVTVGGERLDGRTPLVADLALEAGEHEVRLGLPGADEVRRKVTVEPGQRAVSLHEVLAGGGEVQVETRPAGATVLLDGQDVGKTPLTLDSVPYDRVRRLEVRLEGRRTQAVELPVDRPEVHVVKLRLEQEGSTGKLVVLSSPAAEIVLSGQRLGQTSLEPFAAPTGEHELVLVVPGLGVEQRYLVAVPEQGVGSYFFELTAGTER